MIHPDTQVHCLDLFIENSIRGSINDIFQKYYHKAVIKDNGKIKVAEIDFTQDPLIKITDLFGWTDVIKIQKVPFNYESDRWIDVLVANKQLMVTDNTLIPFYRINDSKRGFHGEVKYSYTLRYPLKSKPGDYLRLRNGINPDGSETEFAIPELISFNKSDYDHMAYGFRIITKSRFYNANDIHLFGGEYINEEELDKRFK